MDAGELSDHAQQLLGAEPEMEVPHLRSSHLRYRLQTAHLCLMALPLPLVLVPPTHTVMPTYRQIMDGSLHPLRHQHHQWLCPLWISRTQMAFTLRQVPFLLLRYAEAWKLLNPSHRHLLHPRLPLTPPRALALPH